MLEEIVRVVVRLSAGVVLGVVPGALYAGLVGAVHLGVYGRWDRVPAFAVGCVMVGALFGLLGGIGWALSGEAAPGSSRSPAASRSHVTEAGQSRNLLSQIPLGVPARQSSSARVGGPGSRCYHQWYPVDLA